jgi:hypothetical protein
LGLSTMRILRLIKFKAILADNYEWDFGQSHTGEQMNNSTWVPDLSNPQHKERTLKLIKRAAGWANACLSDNGRPLAKEWLTKELGDQSKNLGAWLRSKLLICTNDNFYFGDKGSKCKEYKLNRDGLAEVVAVLDGAIPTPGTPAIINGSCRITNPCDVKVIRYWMEHAAKDELDNLEFEYKDQSDRLWHRFQNMRSDVKANVWPTYGLPYDYDIKACAPTLILQRAQQLGMDEFMFGITDYLNNTVDFRQHVAGLAGLDYSTKSGRKVAKTIINALFCGAKLGANKQFDLFMLIGEDHTRMAALRNDIRLARLRSDIKVCWSTISKTFEPDRDAKGHKKPMTSNQKWQIYFGMERAVLNVVNQYLKDNNIKCFLEHDGFRTDQAIDVLVLSDVVFVSTGFRVEFV